MDHLAIKLARVVLSLSVLVVTRFAKVFRNFIELFQSLRRKQICPQYFRSAANDLVQLFINYFWLHHHKAGLVLQLVDQVGERIVCPRTSLV